MKYLLAMLGGFTLTLCVFVGGAAFAVAYLTAEPHTATADALVPFTASAVRVDTAQQDFERTKARSTVPHLMQGAQAQIEITDTTTVFDEISKSATGRKEHGVWCTDRYRSYLAADNSYTSYGGDKRECISPFSDETVTSPSIPDKEASYIEASTGGADAGYAEDTQHIEYCDSRYRSYRPEDNTYQPYGGGLRRQCE